MSTDLSTDDLLATARQRLKRYCHNILGAARSRADTSDIAQEAAIQVWQDADKIQGKTEAERNAWLAKVARGHGHNIRRHHSAQRRSVASEEPVSPDVLSHAGVSPESDFQTRQRHAALAEAVAALNEDQQFVVYSHVFEDQPFTAIAAQLGKSPKVCKRILRDALNALRHRLDRSDV